MTEQERLERRHRIVRSILGTITQRTERDKQASIGPSEIGDPCAHCVGKALCRKYPELWWDTETSPWEAEPGPHGEGFGLAAWVGTAIHEKLERDHLYGAKESTVTVWELPDYGLIKGHVDLIQEGVPVDYKTAWVDDIKQYKLAGPPIKLQYQPQLYGMGVENGGGKVDEICLFFIPRDTNNLTTGHWAGFAPYRREAAERALARLERIWRLVQDGKGGELESDANCYECSAHYKLQWNT